jgi:aconitate hydratase 1
MAMRERGVEIESLPFSIRILLENLLRNYDGNVVTEEHIDYILDWRNNVGKEIPFFPTRVLLQDYTGIPLIVDLASMRSAFKRMGKDPSIVNPIVPADLVIDHSIQVDYYGTRESLLLNMQREFERNEERYKFLRWAQEAFRNLRVFPPGRGIVHQVNLEYLSKVIDLREYKGELTAFPDTLIGTDSHTTMVNGLSVLGWGVGGIEAEAAMLGQPYYITVPDVIGVKLTGELQEGVTPTDLVLTITETLRAKGVVNKFVEFFGPSVKNLSVPDRATIGNMAPEYGATVGFFPIDDSTLSYLIGTGRSREHVELVKRYSEEQGLYYKGIDAEYSEVVEIDLSRVEPSVAGPRNPEERIPLRGLKEEVRKLIRQLREKEKGKGFTSVIIEGKEYRLEDGSIIISAITSCTNTSNPTVMIGAGLIAKKAVEKGLKVKPYVKTSLAPGSIVVTEYLKEAGLLNYLEELKFNVVGYGCTTCIGNSGPLRPEVEKAIRESGIYSVAVLSGNRNFDGRIHPLAKMAFLMSPMLVVVFGLAGRIDVNLLEEPIGYNDKSEAIYLKDLWPSMREIRSYMHIALNPDLYKKKYSNILEGDEKWKKLEVQIGEIYNWDEKSTYIREAPWFKDIKEEGLEDIFDARVLALFGDRITTDHISPAGTIQEDSPAGKYLKEMGVKPIDFNTYGARRGNHEVMVRGGFANIKLRNLLVEREGGYTKFFPTGEVLPIYDAAMKYISMKTPLIIIAGKQYGAGSSRDWAAKATALLGVKAVIAESYERIHRSNLVSMGVLPLQFLEGQGWKQLGLRGDEVYSIIGIKNLKPRKEVEVVAKRSNGEEIKFKAIARVDTNIELEYYKSGGLLPYMFRKLISS